MTDVDQKPPAAGPAAPPPAVRLASGGWEDVLDALGSAAVLTAQDIDCDACRESPSCPAHDARWQQTDRWRALAKHIRGQLTEGIHGRTGPPQLLVERLEDLAYHYFRADGRPSLSLGWQQDFIAHLANYLAENGTDIGYTDGSRVRSPRS